MNPKLKHCFIISAYVLIPLLAVLACIGFRVAQGEKNEEIVFGLMAGILLDAIYGSVLTIMAKFKR